MNRWRIVVILAVAGFSQLCLVASSSGNFTRRATRLRKIDFPTLFYPGPDRKLVTMAPHEVPVSSIGVGFPNFKLKGRTIDNSGSMVQNFHPNGLPTHGDFQKIKSPLHVIDLRPKDHQSPSLFEQNGSINNDQPIEPEGSQFPFVSAPVANRAKALRRPHMISLAHSNKNMALRPYPVGDLPLRALISPPNAADVGLMAHIQRQPHFLMPAVETVSIPLPPPTSPRPAPQFNFEPVSTSTASNSIFQATFVDESELLFTPPPVRRPPPPPPPQQTIVTQLQQQQPPFRAPHSFNPPIKVHIQNSNTFSNNNNNHQVAPLHKGPPVQWKSSVDVRPPPPRPPLPSPPPRHQQPMESHQNLVTSPVHQSNDAAQVLQARQPHFSRTRFSCRDWPMNGYYADIEAGCQMFHVCYEKRQFTFLCPNGTLFDQRYMVCSWWYGVDCPNSVANYGLNSIFLDDNQHQQQRRL